MAPRPDVARFQDSAVRSLARGDYEAALRACAALERLEPANPDWPKRTAKVLRRMNRVADEAQALLRAVDIEIKVGGELRAAGLLKQVLDLFPTHAGARARLARLQRNRPAPRRPPPPTVTPAQAASWQAVQRAGLDQLPLREVVEGAAQAESTGVYRIPLESADLEGSSELGIDLDELDESPATPNRPDSSFGAPAADPRASSGAEDAIILAVEEELREAAQADKALSATPLFSELDETQLSRVLMQAKREEHAKDGVIIRQGDKGQTLYVVAEGTVGVIDEGPPRRGISKLGEGSFFGEIALLTEQPRNATVVALTDVVLIGLDRSVVAAIAAEDPSFLAALLRFFRDRSVTRMLVANPLFGALSDSDRGAIKARFRFLEVEKGAKIVTEGRKPEGLIVLLSGTAEASRREGNEVVPLGVLASGDLIAEMSLMTGAPAMGTVVATSKCYAVELAASDFHKVVNARPKAKAVLERMVAERRSVAPNVTERPGGDGQPRRVAF